MGLEKIPGSKVFVGSKPESTSNFINAKIKTLFAIHINPDLKLELEKKGVKVHIIPPILDPIISTKLISKIVSDGNRTKGNIAFTCMAGAHVSNAYAGIYLSQKGWPLDKIMGALDKVSVKASRRHISPGLAEGIRETIKFSHQNFLETVRAIKKKAVRKKTVKKKTRITKPVIRRK